LLGIPFRRPDDYFAEMIKDDKHMGKVKNVLLKEKRLMVEAGERKKNRYVVFFIIIVVFAIWIFS
jgi:rRNA-processing protein EBP2